LTLPAALRSLRAVQTSFYDALFATFAFVLGAMIGSFLNVCIYRMPRDLSVNQPRRSFCPSCNYQIPWWRNIPLWSWLALRGKCANCGTRIPFRYFGVELLTGLLFLAVWWKVWPQHWALALPYWIFASLLIVATFIDFEHFIIPDEITWGGAAAGLVLSLAIPAMHGTASHLMGFVWSLAGAACGYGLLWGVVELGKLAFGKKRLAFDAPQKLRWVRKGEDADLAVGDEQMLWSDFFVRGNEQLLMDCPVIEVDGECFEKTEVRWTLDWLHVGERKWELVKTDVVAGEVTEVTFPREAMGFGDVKFLACIGAFLGWKATLFTVMAASVAGALVGIVAIAARRREWSVKIPFGPYLALGSLVWLFAGPRLVQWYWSFAVAK
jgi:leader peptidase (prepilin peptidase) / N-methyltransferase